MKMGGFKSPYWFVSYRFVDFWFGDCGYSRRTVAGENELRAVLFNAERVILQQDAA